MNDYYSVEHWTILKNIDEGELRRVEQSCVSISYSYSSPYFIKRDVNTEIDTYYFHYSVLEEYFTHGPAF